MIFASAAFSFFNGMTMLDRTGFCARALGTAAATKRPKNTA